MRYPCTVESMHDPTPGYPRNPFAVRGGKRNSRSRMEAFHGTPMAQSRSTEIISMIKWIRTSRLSMKNSLSPQSYLKREKATYGKVCGQDDFRCKLKIAQIRQSGTNWSKSGNWSKSAGPDLERGPHAAGVGIAERRAWSKINP